LLLQGTIPIFKIRVFPQLKPFFSDKASDSSKVHPIMAIAALLWLLVASPAMAGEPIRAGSEIAYPPFCIEDENGRAGGFSVELMRAAANAMDRKVVFRTGKWAEVKGWLKKGEVRALPLVGRTPEREADFDFTFPYISLHGAIVVRKRNTEIQSIADLDGQKVAVMAGDNAEAFLRQKKMDIRIRTTPTFEDALRGLSRGGCDAVVVQRLVAIRLLQKSGLENLKILDSPVEGFRQQFCFAVKEGDHRMLSLLNEGLSIVMADGTYRRLNAKWFAALKLPLHGPIVVGGDQNFPPYEFIDKNGRPAGYNVELTRAIAREMDLDIKIRLGPWNKIRRQLAGGRIDALQGMFYSAGRDLKFDFTPAHTVNHQVSIVRREDGPPPTTAAELAGMQIVVQRGDIMHDFARKKGLGEQVDAVSNQKEALGELARGSYDCALGSRATALYLIDKNGWDQLVVAQKPFLSPQYCYAVPNNQKTLLAHFTEGLKMLEESGEYQRIHDKWMGVYQEQDHSLLTALRRLAMVFIPLVAVLLAVFLWSWSLRRQVGKRTEELKENEEFLRAMISCSPVALYSIDRSGRVTAWNQSAERVFGWSPEEVIGRPLPIVPEDKKAEFDQFRDQILHGQTLSGVAVLRRRKDGSLFHASLSAAPIYSVQTGEIIGIMGSVEDITEHRKLEEQLRQAQKMEAVGRLAGGVAHDYNNMLSVITGYAELALDQVTPGAPPHAELSEILSSAKRSTDITRQLLAFARKQTIQPEVLDLNATVEGMLKMLRRLIGEDVELAWLPAPQVWPVRMDPAQIDQLLANLCVNARDAISGIGRISIETGNVHLDEAYAAEHPGFIPGDFVLLSVSDNGCGMDKDTMDNIFEPFYTTKGDSRGTGLGLATVFGIVKQNQGFINVYSEPAQGSTFRIYLPRHAAEAEGKTPEIRTEAPRGRNETLLLVEDDPPILEMTRMMLERLGYRVLAAATPGEALKTASETQAGIDLLVTDVVMPEMNGRDLSENLRALDPGIKILFMSGYTSDVIAHNDVLAAGVHFIQKPFTKQELAAKVREILDQDQPSPA